MRPYMGIGMPRDARAGLHARNARADRAKHRSCDRANLDHLVARCVDHVVVSEGNWFLVYGHEHNIQKRYAPFLNVYIH